MKTQDKTENLFDKAVKNFISKYNYKYNRSNLTSLEENNMSDREWLELVRKNYVNQINQLEDELENIDRKLSEMENSNNSERELSLAN